MANHRVGETGLSDSGPSNQPLVYGVHSNTPAATNFFDLDGPAYFGELEEALMQGVVGIRNDGDRKSLYTTKPPTLEIFPSWPIRHQQTTRGTLQSAESTDSGSAQNPMSQMESESPVSRKASSDQSAEHRRNQELLASGVYRTAATAAANQQPKTQEKESFFTQGSSGQRSHLDTSPNKTPAMKARHQPNTESGQTLRRLAQNREAARKSRLRKKAYVQQLESSRIKLAQLEQDFQRARSQGLFLGGTPAGSISSGAAMFDMDYARWLDEDYKHLAELRGGVQAHLPDSDLRVIVDECLTHYDEIFRLKGIAAKSDVFHLITGLWTTPAERCFLWMGGFRPSELLKILMPQLDPLTDPQLAGICSLQQSSQQAEEALSQGLEQLQQSLADTIASGALNEGANVGNYMGHMAMALGKLANLEGFLRQADNLRQQTLHQMCRLLTIRQAARCFLAIGEYYSRLRALSSLWASRPKENLISDESGCPSTTTSLQMIHQPVHNHFSF